MRNFVYLIIGLMILYSIGCQSKEQPQSRFIAFVVNNDAKKVAETLATGGVDVNSQNGDAGPALTIASYGGFKDIVAMLLERGADINIRDKKGTTPLMNAIVGDQPEIVELLLEKGADVSISIGKNDAKGEPITANTLARIKGNKEIIDLLKKQSPKH